MTETKIPEAPIPTEDARAREALGLRLRIAGGLAFVGVVAALLGALGPAERLRTTYSWPPPDVPESAPPRLWYTPLLLSRHQPAIDLSEHPVLAAASVGAVHGPCSRPGNEPLSGASGGLAVTRADDELVVRVGDDDPDSGAIPGRPDRRQRAPSGFTWKAGTGGSTAVQDDLTQAGQLPRMPTVTGLFSGLELGSDSAPSIDVVTKTHASRTTLRQMLAWAIALVALGSALLLIAFGSRRGLSLTAIVRSALKGCDSPARRTPSSGSSLSGGSSSHPRSGTTDTS